MNRPLPTLLHRPVRERRRLGRESRAVGPRRGEEGAVGGVEQVGAEPGRLERQPAPREAVAAPGHGVHALRDRATLAPQGYAGEPRLALRALLRDPGEAGRALSWGGAVRCRGRLAAAADGVLGRRVVVHVAVAGDRHGVVGGAGRAVAVGVRPPLGAHLGPLAGLRVVGRRQVAAPGPRRRGGDESAHHQPSRGQQGDRDALHVTGCRLHGCSLSSSPLNEDAAPRVTLPGSVRCSKAPPTLLEDRLTGARAGVASERRRRGLVRRG